MSLFEEFIMLSFVCGFMRGFGVMLLVASFLAISARTVVADDPDPGPPAGQCGNVVNWNCNGNNCWSWWPNCTLHSMGGGVYECHCTS